MHSHGFATSGKDADRSCQTGAHRRIELDAAVVALGADQRALVHALQEDSNRRSYGNVDKVQRTAATTAANRLASMAATMPATHLEVIDDDGMVVGTVVVPRFCCPLLIWLPRVVPVLRQGCGTTGQLESHKSWSSGNAQPRQEVKQAALQQAVGEVLGSASMASCSLPSRMMTHV